MMGIKARVVVSVALLLLVSSVSFLVQPVKALGGGDTWYGYYQYNPDTQYNTPENISSQITVYSPNNNFWAKVALVVNVYEYNRFGGYNAVNFKVALYFDSFSTGSVAVTASSVSFFIEKDAAGSNLNTQTIDVVTIASRPGISRGYGVEQKISGTSSPDDRQYWALKPLAYLASLFSETVDAATNLIGLATAFVPEPGLDYEYAGLTDMQASTWWRNPGYVFQDSPVRQYAYNTIQWLQTASVIPSTYMGIKVRATVGLVQPYLGVLYIHTPPVFLQIHGYGGGGTGCPRVSAWNGTQYVFDNNLIPGAEHSNGTDVVDYYSLQQPVARDEGKYSLLISDTDKHSFLDRVQLLAVDHKSDVNVAVSPYGEILTYRNPASPVTAISQDGEDLTNILGAIDGQYFEGSKDDYVTLDFGDLDTSNGAKLVLRTDPGCEPNPCKDSIHVQISNATGHWSNVARFIPRIYWANDIIDLSSYLPDANGDLKVRLYLTAHHKIDYAALDTTAQAKFEQQYANLATANHSRLGDVKELFKNSDNLRVELLPGEHVTLQFTAPQLKEERRDFIIILEGHYFIIS